LLLCAKHLFVAASIVRERRAVSYWARSEGMDKVVGVRTVPGAAADQCNPAPSDLA